MFNNNNNSKYGNSNGSNNRLNVNTFIRNFYSDISSMMLNYWNENLSIKINPIMSISEDGKRQYNYDRKVITALTVDKAIALKEKIDDVIIPKINEIANGGSLDSSISEMVMVNGNSSAVGFEYKNDEKNVPSLYLTIYSNIDENGNVPDGYAYSYKFAKTTVLENYNGKNGSGDEKVIETEFMYVYDIMKSLTEVRGVTPHAITIDNSDKSNYQASNNQNNNYGNNYNNNYSNNQQVQSTPTFSAPMSTFNENSPF